MNKFKVLLVYPNLMLVSTLPNNIALLSACLKKSGNDVRLFDATLYRTAEKSNDEMRVDRMQVRTFDMKQQGVTLKQADIYAEFKNTVNDYKPNLVAVSVVDDTVDMGLELVKAAQCKKKAIPVIFGGVHVYFSSEKLIKDPAVDILCTGEGEVTLPAVCKALKGKKALKDIPNLMFKHDNIITRTPLADPIDINTLPYEDFSIFEAQRFYRPMQGRVVKTLPINLDRGCPYLCTFCNASSISQMYKKANRRPYFRQKTLETIYNELKYQIARYNVEYIYFNSETFLTMPLGKLKKFAQMYAKFNLPFWCQTRIETVTDEKIKILKGMNCDRLSVGLEHGNEDFRKRILKKSFSNRQAARAFDIFKKYKIKISVNNMMGFPGETRQLIFDTVNINRRLKSDSVNGFVFQPYTGTELREYSIKKGFLNESDLKSTQGTPIGESVLNMPTLSAREINGLLRTFVLYVKMPKRYYIKIKAAEKPDKQGDLALAELRQVLFDKYF